LFDKGLQTAMNVANSVATEPLETRMFAALDEGLDPEDALLTSSPSKEDCCFGGMF
jgi:hypothetical protein